MVSDPTIREQGYIYFLREAPELLQVIEQELLTLLEDHSVAKVHSLMRATHTLKGSAANVGLEVIQTVAHYLEDVVKTLYNPDLVVDAELQMLLLQGYECLREPLMAELQGGSINKEEILDRISAIFAQLQVKLGDFFGAEAQIPSSIELGFDIVQSVFEMGVGQRLEAIAAALENLEAAEVASLLRYEAEVFIGLAESLNLPGFRAIATTTLAALNAHPEMAVNIATIALVDFQGAREQVLAGDRTIGGMPSEALQQLAGEDSPLHPEKPLQAGSTEILASPKATTQPLTPDTQYHGSELEQFYEFITSDRYNSKQPLQPKVSQFYLRAARYCLQWFHRYQHIPQSNLSLALLVPNLQQQDTAIQEAKVAAKYVEDWLESFLFLVTDESDSESLRLYRHGTLLTVILAVAKFQYFDQTNDPKEYRDISLIQILESRRIEVIKKYKKHPPISEEEKKWLESPQLKKLLERRNFESLEHLPAADSLVEEIWGKPPAPPSTSIELTTPESTDSLVEEIWGKPTASQSTSIQLTTPEAVVPLAQELQISAINTQKQLAETLSPQHLQRHIEQSLESIDTEKVDFNNNPSSKTVGNPSTAQVPRQSVRVDLEELERLNYLAGNLLINQNRQVLQDEQLQEAVQNLRANLERHKQTLNQLRDWSNLMLIEPDYQRTVLKGYTSGVLANSSLHHRGQGELHHKQQTAFDSLELDRYTELYSLFNLAIDEALQLGAATDAIEQISKQFSYTLEKQQSLLSHVRKDMTAAQMLPLGDVLGRFTRMIQQLATAKKKPVELKITGGQVLVDKAIAEKLYDPLLHLVRNAFDHGIEPADVRRHLGKRQEGQIEIHAYHQGNQTIIEVRDDGQGLDFEAIRNRAVELNFVSAQQVSQLSKAQLLDLLFKPGFSTRAAVSDLSGRGIGLDVVQNQLQSLKGSITVESQPQMGTTFSLQIPFSLTSAKFFVCQAGGVTYALLSETIAKIVLPQPEQIQVFEGKKVLMYGQGYATSSGTDTDARILPVHQLSELIGYTSVSAHSLLAKNRATPMKGLKRQTTDNTQLFLLRGNTGLFGLEVDQILGEQELVIRPLGTAISAPSYIFGCSILGDGKLILAIDGAVLVEQAFSPGKRHQTEANFPVLPASPRRPTLLPASNALSPSVPVLAAEQTAGRQLPPGLPLSPKTILVVDDSLSYRQTLAMNLEKAGYRVYQAQDGLEALELLRQSSDIGLVICDIEMPRVNGFEFLNHWRQDPALAKIPVVMLTSRNSEKHRLLASELGAAAYFTKPYLEQELLRTIAELK
ncbi:MAG: hybrid sensor histidine kinase/response regulator [Aphanothece sp. CMT-3BRIN-NPC111]|jgi:chemotaxis family two-component system sensor histidine kinase/response regulator PixL|nr:hybrid sensor histidine kinase/response regulator [Aphanothece sp. CMT-3BRIN-NPC111]